MAERVRPESIYGGNSTPFNGYTRPGGGYMGTGMGDPSNVPDTPFVGGTTPRVRTRGSESTGFWQWDPISGKFIRGSPSRYNDANDPRRACRPSDVGAFNRAGDDAPPPLEDTVENLKTLLAAQVEAYRVDFERMKGALKEAGIDFAILKGVSTIVSVIPWVGKYGGQIIDQMATGDYVSAKEEITLAAHNFYYRMQVRQLVSDTISQPSYTYKADDGIDIMDTCSYPPTVEELAAVWGPLKPINSLLLWVAGGLALALLLAKKKKKTD